MNTIRSTGHVPPRRVYIESPYAGDRQFATLARNLRYLRACMADCLRRGEAPFASHGLYTQPGVLRDEIPEERARGIAAGSAFRPVCAATIVYADLGVSPGMHAGVAEALEIRQMVETRRLGEGWDAAWQEKWDVAWQGNLEVDRAEVYRKLADLMWAPIPAEEERVRIVEEAIAEVVAAAVAEVDCIDRLNIRGNDTANRLRAAVASLNRAQKSPI
jgi:hypothetical protein